ncbi:MAG: hypothetical protein MO852_08890 [Candidatus Devosia euplotis]|nr:hypothetical protein [Candidatus Devosia euplotis]
MLSTLLINIAGSVFMGVFIGLLARLMPPQQAELRLFVAVGLLGGLHRVFLVFARRDRSD